MHVDLYGQAFADACRAKQCYGNEKRSGKKYRAMSLPCRVLWKRRKKGSD